MTDTFLKYTFITHSLIFPDISNVFTPFARYCTVRRSRTCRQIFLFSPHCMKLQPPLIRLTWQTNYQTCLRLMSIIYTDRRSAFFWTHLNYKLDFFLIRLFYKSWETNNNLIITHNTITWCGFKSCIWNKIEAESRVDGLFYFWHSIFVK